MLAKTEGPWANRFEAIPIERAGDGFKLRWRDYANLPPVIRPRFELALICPDVVTQTYGSGLQRPEPFLSPQMSAAAVTASAVRFRNSNHLHQPCPAQLAFAIAVRGPLAGTTPPYTQETTMISKTEHIRALNDALRQNFHEGTAVMTTGVAALGAEAVARIVKTIAVYDDFCHANDPYEEHDFGSFEVDGHTIF